MVWLGVALLISVLLLALVPSLARLLALGLEGLSAALASPDAPSSATFKSAELLVVARLLVLAGELLIVQAVLRRPIAIVLGGDRQMANVEAGIAGGALFLILPRKWASIAVAAASSVTSSDTNPLQRRLQIGVEAGGPRETSGGDSTPG